MHQHLKDQLAELRLCLVALPTDIPIRKESKYKFSDFSPDAEWIAEIGEAAAINRELEVRLGSRVNGLKLVERGLEMEAIVHVFETWTKKYPGDIILEKWVNDTLEAARGLILAAGKALPVPASKLSSMEKKPVKVNHTTQIPEKCKHKVQKLNTHILSTFNDDQYISAGEDEDNRKGGAKMHPLLRKVSKPSHLAIMVDYLKTQLNLTIMFDGGKIRKPKSFYTVHVTTADRRTLLLELDDSSMLSHTARYIGELLESVILDIRPYRFSGSSLDDTGNTKNSRNITHTSQNSTQQHSFYLQVSDHLRKILAFMDKSSYAMEHFNYQCSVLKIGRGLEEISKTQFANIHWSAASLQRCLPAMQAILVAITGPYAKAIQCLESAQTTCADVYLYWLAIIAQMEQLLQGNTICLQKETKMANCATTNVRFNQMINNTPNDPYITAFFLHLEYQIALIYKNINPLDLPPIHLTKSNGMYSVVSPKDSIVKRVGMRRQLMLKHEYGDVYDVVKSDQAAAKLMKERNPRLAGLTPQDALQALKVELKEYHKGADPFNRKICKHENIRDWWLAVQKDENVRVLGVTMLSQKLYSVVPVSMANERTVSTITWLNGPTQSRQEISTLKEHIQIRQWHHWQVDVSEVQSTVEF
ncbi:uncharacterized protein EDB91DRAFT_1062575 [Suillus paluster]|uniref:uncharacterized protein n=1 Tax=Suillus paluster TaxID=48578 RepID=UPI001B86EAE4|nr:uncharacterized protein EDB91DRAFT_1062575 [Suillus paluster]KAG1724896.1 hypothetical protein EDB91DRAFT_1062575 [Suillus paluster]